MPAPEAKIAPAHSSGPLLVAAVLAQRVHSNSMILFGGEPGHGKGGNDSPAGGATTALAGATYLLNLIAAQVPAVAAFSPLSGALVCVCAAAGIGVLRAAGRRR
jgi:hypothetical protein